MINRGVLHFSVLHNHKAQFLVFCPKPLFHAAVTGLTWLPVCGIGRLSGRGLVEIELCSEIHWGKVSCIV